MNINDTTARFISSTKQSDLDDGLLDILIVVPFPVSHVQIKCQPDVGSSRKNAILSHNPIITNLKDKQIIIDVMLPCDNHSREIFVK